MTISVELLNTTKAELSGPMVNTFVRNVPLHARLEKKGRILSEGGTYVERPMMTGSSARGIGLFNGDEPADLTRYKKTEKFQVELHRIFVAIAIPKKELDLNKGRNGAVKLLEAYPKATIAGIANDLEKYYLTGASLGLVMPTAELYGFTPLNGQFAAGVNTGTTNGLLDFTTPALQTDSVQSVVKSVSDYHYNQYGDITLWATDGQRTMRKVYRKCAHFSEKPNGGPDLVIMDDDTYANWTEDKLDITRLVKVSDNPDKDNLVQDVLGRGTVYASDFIDIATDFTGDAADGVTYMVNTDFLEMPVIVKPKLSDFKEVIGDQDAVVAHFIAHYGLLMTKFPAHGCVSGGSA